MRTQLGILSRALWRDDLGGIVTTEYLALGTVLVLGGVGGLEALSNSMNQELAEYGKSVSAINQSYRQATRKTSAAAKQGSAAQDQVGEPLGVNCCP